MEIRLGEPYDFDAVHVDRSEVVGHVMRGDRQGGEPLVALEGSPTYYATRGFVFAGDLGLTPPIPGWAPRDAAQVRLFTAYDANDPTLRGAVIYPPPSA